jgi:hypothetical protein
LLALPPVLAAQGATAGQSGRRELLPEAREVALARSAAPASISAAASVWVLTDSGYRLAAEGSNGVGCLVSRSWITALEPVCYDPEGTRSIMRMEMLRTEMLHAGRSVAEAEEAVSAAIREGAIPRPSRVAVSWMQSAAQQLVSDDGRPVGAWRPHLMLYSPGFTPADLGLSSGAAAGGITIVDGGSAKAMLLIVAGEFVQLVEAGR